MSTAARRPWSPSGHWQTAGASAKLLVSGIGTCPARPHSKKAFDRTPVARRVGRTRSPPTGSGSVGRVGTRGTDDHRRRRLRPLAGQGQGSLSDAEDLLHEARKAYGLSHLVYESGERIGVVRTVICTIQTERRDEYVERRRTLIDPVRKWSLKSRMPVEWAA